MPGAAKGIQTRLRWGWRGLDFTGKPVTFPKVGVTLALTGKHLKKQKAPLPSGGED